MLSDTENLLLQGKVTYKETGKVITWYSNDGTLPPQIVKTGSSILLHFRRHLTHVYSTVYEI